MKCPSCGFEQEGGLTECQKCQVIFSKWHEKEVKQQIGGYGQMTEQVYSTPRKKRSSIIAIFIAVIITGVIQMICAVIVGFAAGIKFAKPGMSQEQVQQALIDSTGFNIAMLVVLVFGSILAGFIAASKAGHEEVKHGLVMGILGVVFTLIFLQMGTPEQLLGVKGWVVTVDLILGIPLCVLGGYWAKG